MNNQTQLTDLGVALEKIQQLKQQLEEAVEVIEFYLSKDMSDCIFKSDEDRHRQFLAKYHSVNANEMVEKHREET